MDKKISISSKILDLLPDTRLGAVFGKVRFEKYNPELWKAIDEEINRIGKLKIEEIKNIPQIATTRAAYRALGKEPARYRPSAEALLRRIIQGKGLYKISNIVDTINLASIKTGYSIGGYDYDKIQGDIVFDVGRSDDEYQAIGRGKINVENLPVFRDRMGAFGSPTTDSVRTMITETTQNVLLIVINFGVKQGFEQDLMLISRLLEKYANGQEIRTWIVDKFSLESV